ncbi:flagellar hook-basal body complex protein FliE [Cellulomonas sp. URHD0024]|uniref:flagellar hook-basal body complex protein FliE n=1 Tax=Cellulomonas sp. URHD0024 TaxID=1302620 RepID=UPI00040BE500|nr:flagellar hook-basal body complex protein FliE [Cellulomonas sp. URHD0024]
MTIPISAISGVTSVAAPTAPVAPAATGSTSGAGFANILSGVDNLQQLQSTTNDLAVKAVTGDLTDVHDYSIAAAESSTALELTAAVRNKAVEAFNEIMRMQG